MNPSAFVNIHGAPWNPSAAAITAPKKEPKPTQEWHKGWRVTGIAPEELAGAKEQAKRAKQPFDQEAWMRHAKRKAVRSKPYSILEAASDCARLAEKAGWIAVRCDELKSKG